MRSPRVVVLGAGFGGLEATAVLAEAFGPSLDLTLLDQSDAFVFGYSKLDVMFGLRSPAAARLPYGRMERSGVRFRQETARSIDPGNRSVVTDRGKYEADYLVIALGADLDLDASPGLREVGQEFYSLAGATEACARLGRFRGGRAVVGVVSSPYKCPPAPSEAALLLDEYLSSRPLRGSSQITLTVPLPAPIPPVPAASQALLTAFRDRGVEFLPEQGIREVDGARGRVVLSGGEELPFDLLLGVPAHCVPAVVTSTELTVDGWVKVDPRTLATPFPGVYAVGDLADLEVPKAGMFAEGEARTAAAGIVAEVQGGPRPAPYDGAGACYIEFGRSEVARVDVAFGHDDEPTGTYVPPSGALAAEKRAAAQRRAARWRIG